VSLIRTLAWGILVGMVLPASVRADSLTTGSWTIFFDPTDATENLINLGATSTAKPVDAFINLGTASYSEASALTTGTAQPWYLSPAVSQVYGHTPTAAEQSDFASKVLADVNATYAQAGLHPQITTDAGVTANHTISVVSGLSYAGNAAAIGITDVGHDGFGFIDKLKFAGTPDQLAWAVAHNVAHELMHAFGVGIHPDQTGGYLDAASATWNLLTDPNARFSPDAVKLIGATNFGPSVSSAGTIGATGLQVDGGQEIMTVPEPTTLAVWSIVAVGGLCFGRRTARARAA
jgi:hypothetical protein